MWLLKLIVMILGGILLLVIVLAVAEVIISKNELRQCKDCRKLHRKYQEDLYKKVNNIKNDYHFHCPHCKKTTKRYEGDIAHPELMEHQPEWTYTHPDCPKINMFQHRKIKQTARQILKNQKLQKDQEFFEEYNKIEVDFSWINNLKDSVK